MGTVDREKLTEWVEALESGKYTQCKTQLTDDKGNFCCIGVLGKINGHKPEDMYSGREISAYDICERITGGGTDASFFWHMNDRDGRTFKEIAEVIRERWLND